MSKQRQIATIKARVDKQTLKQAQAVFAALGLDLDTGLNLYLKAVARERRIPLTLALPLSDAMLARAKADVQAGRVETYPDLATYRDAMDSL